MNVVQLWGSVGCGSSCLIGGAGAQLLCLYPCRCPLVLLLKSQPKAVDYVLDVPAINPLPTAWPCSPAIAQTFACLPVRIADWCTLALQGRSIVNLTGYPYMAHRKLYSQTQQTQQTHGVITVSGKSLDGNFTATSCCTTADHTTWGIAWLSRHVTWSCRTDWSHPELQAH